jgi:hypothetical protein
MTKSGPASHPAGFDDASEKPLGAFVPRRVEKLRWRLLLDDDSVLEEHHRQVLLHQRTEDSDLLEIVDGLVDALHEPGSILEQEARVLIARQSCEDATGER